MSSSPTNGGGEHRDDEARRRERARGFGSGIVDYTRRRVTRERPAEPPRFAKRETWSDPFPRTATSMKERCPVRTDSLELPKHRVRRAVLRLLVYVPVILLTVATVAVCLPLRGPFFARMLEKVVTGRLDGLELRVGTTLIDLTRGEISARPLVLTDTRSGASLRLGEVRLRFDPVAAVQDGVAGSLSEVRIVGEQTLGFLLNDDGELVPEAKLARLIQTIRNQLTSGEARSADAAALIPDVRVTNLDFEIAKAAPGDTAGARVRDHYHAERLSISFQRESVSGALRLDTRGRRTGNLVVQYNQIGERHYGSIHLTRFSSNAVPIPLELGTTQLSGWFQPESETEPTEFEISGSIDRLAFDSTDVMFDPSRESVRRSGRPTVAWTAGPLDLFATAAWSDGSGTFEPGVTYEASLVGDGLDLRSAGSGHANDPITATTTIAQLAPLGVNLAAMGLSGDFPESAFVVLESGLTAHLQLATANEVFSEPQTESRSGGRQRLGGSLRIGPADTERPVRIILDAAGEPEHTVDIGGVVEGRLSGAGDLLRGLELRLSDSPSVAIDNQQLVGLELHRSARDEESPTDEPDTEWIPLDRLALQFDGRVGPELIEHFAPGTMQQVDPATIAGDVGWRIHAPLGDFLARRNESLFDTSSLEIDLAGLRAGLPDRMLTADVIVEGGILRMNSARAELIGARVRFVDFVADLAGSLDDGILAIDGTLAGDLDCLERGVPDIAAEMLLDGDARGVIRVRAGSSLTEARNGPFSTAAQRRGSRQLELVESARHAIDAILADTHEMQLTGEAENVTVGHVSMPALARNAAGRVRMEGLTLIFEEMTGEIGSTPAVRGGGSLEFRVDDFPRLVLELEADDVDVAEWLEYWHPTPPPPPDVIARRTRRKAFEMELHIRANGWNARDPFSTGLHLNGTKGETRVSFRSEVGPGKYSRQEVKFLPGGFVEAYGGRVQFEGKLVPGRAGQPGREHGEHEFIVKGRNIQLGPLASDAARVRSNLTGLLDVDGFVRGPLEPEERALAGLDGAWRLSVRRSNLLTIPYFRFLIDALGFGNAIRSGYATLDGTVVIHNGQAWTSNLLLRHTIVGVLFQGMCELRGGALDGRLIVKTEDSGLMQTPILKELAMAIGLAINDAANLLVSLRLAGSVGEPRTVARPTAALMDELRVMFGGEDVVPSATGDVTAFPFKVPRQLIEVRWDSGEL